jgi:hypothetical protein
MDEDPPIECPDGVEPSPGTEILGRVLGASSGVRTPSPRSRTQSDRAGPNGTAPQSSAWPQHAMVEEEVDARPGHEGGELFE